MLGEFITERYPILIVVVLPLVHSCCCLRPVSRYSNRKGSAALQESTVDQFVSDWTSSIRLDPVCRARRRRWPLIVSGSPRRPTNVWTPSKWQIDTTSTRLRRQFMSRCVQSWAENLIRQLAKERRQVGGAKAADRIAQARAATNKKVGSRVEVK